MKKSVFSFLMFFNLVFLHAEDGHNLWLRFDKTKVNAHLFSGISADEKFLATQEFQKAWQLMTGEKLQGIKKAKNEGLIISKLDSKLISSFKLAEYSNRIGNEGYIIKTIQKKGKKYTVVGANTDAGLIYGVFDLLRLIQTNNFTDRLDVVEKPLYELRVLNHWDNLDGTVERGYAGHSIFWRLGADSLVVTTADKEKWQEYARANASIGINGTVLNNVNANPEILSDPYLKKTKTIADVLRPYHIKVYLAVNFSSPKELGGLKDSDPLNPEVRKWWVDKAKEIYKLIPDFGGFLVKANSEGLPGPMDYGRTHADGANLLAKALNPFDGIVMWRAFVYNAKGGDRAKQAYNEFLPLDGKFDDNVIIQVKNGPIDFQPREPFSPLFGAMKQTDLMPELQITQEYLGQGNHLAFLSTMWKEFFESDTYCNGKGSTVAKTTDGTVFNQKHTAIAGVSNIGLDINWTGQNFGQANWYAFGRLAWNHELTSDQIADEWIKMTFSQNKDFVKSTKEMMLSSHETVVNYMMPLGLHHIFAWGHHYGPEPWCEVPNARPDWLPKYYHRADSTGLGFNRTRTGSDAVEQYFPPLNDEFNDIKTCPEKYLLWFHHVSWNYKMKDGKTLWDELCYKYDDGVQAVRTYQKTWDMMEPYVDSARFLAVQSKLRIQSHDAVWWKDACLLYFQQYSKMRIPYDIERPVNNLDDMMKIKLNMLSHN